MPRLGWCSLCTLFCTVIAPAPPRVPVGSLEFGFCGVANGPQRCGHWRQGDVVAVECRIRRWRLRRHVLRPWHPLHNLENRLIVSAELAFYRSDTLASDDRDHRLVRVVGLLEHVVDFTDGDNRAVTGGREFPQSAQQLRREYVDRKTALVLRAGGGRNGAILVPDRIRGGAFGKLYPSRFDVCQVEYRG